MTWSIEILILTRDVERVELQLADHNLKPSCYRDESWHQHHWSLHCQIHDLNAAVCGIVRQQLAEDRQSIQQEDQQ